MSFQINVSDWSIQHANLLIQIMDHTSKPLLFSASLMLLVTWITTKKLCRYADPNNLKISLIVREVASALSLISLIMICAFLIYLLLIFFLAFFAFSLTDDLKANGFFALIAITLKQVWLGMHNMLLPILMGSILALMLAFYLKYFQIPDWESGEGLDDVHDISKVFNQLNGFNPIPYISVEKGCFIGLDENKRAIYVPWKKIRETHIQVIGTTGSGKGVVMSLIVYQAILAGENLIWIDPKFDRFSPRIVAEAAKKASKDFYLINLNPDQPPQLNPFAGAEAFEIEELLVTAFDLKGKGTDGDFHRSKDEDAAIAASRLAIQKNALSIPELIKVCRSVDSITEQENFWRKLSKLGDLNVINTKGGLDLKDAILKNAIIYIVGSTDNERVKMLQKLILVRINQIIKKQDRFKKHAVRCIVLDEFKYVLSPTALTSLSVIRDFDTHCILAHQSLGDLDSCAGITRAEAEGAVLDNTAIKIIYRLGDSTYAEKLSKNSGKKSVFVEQSGKTLDKNNQHQGGWREAHVPLIDTDVLTHLPMPSDRVGQASAGVLFGVGVAKIFHVGHVPTGGPMPAIKAVPAYNAQSIFDSEDMYDLI